VRLTYVTGRGRWYHTSWKGYPDKSGGLATNIGIHFFDLLMWLFGKPGPAELHLDGPRRMAGAIELERADVQWFLSVDPADLPFAPEPGKKATHRSITVDGTELEFSDGFADLHTRVYEQTLAGRGFTIDDARPSIELVHRIRQTPVKVARAEPHPLVATAQSRT
jgi:UDP-N-acetyl-2-amino-2-deoxyglucuronate dehydrogenase